MEQKDREKPGRFDQQYIVQEDGYHVLTDDELKEMFAERIGSRSYNDWMRAFCERKYNADFSVEMSRSVRKYLEDFNGD